MPNIKQCLDNAHPRNKKSLVVIIYFFKQNFNKLLSNFTNCYNIYILQSHKIVNTNY